MNHQDEARHAMGFFKGCLDTLTKKAHDYAQDDDCFSNFRKIADTVEISIEKVFLMFIVVKVARIVELAKKGETKVGESMQDSLTDICNYSCLMHVYLTGEESNEQKKG